MRVPTKILKEIRLLEGRIEAGHSPYQAFSQMNCPLSGPQDFIKSWNKISHSILEGRISGAKTISYFAEIFERSNDLCDLIQQKTMSARIQSAICAGLLLLSLIASLLFFPKELQPELWLLATSLTLMSLAFLVIFFLQKQFEKKLLFSNWILFLKLISISIECGNTLQVAEREHPIPKELYLQNNGPLWLKAKEDWKLIQKHNDEGFPLLKLIHQLSKLSEKDFERNLKIWAEKLSFQLLIPLVFLATPALYLLLLGPLLTKLLGHY
jgi:hypothetical protein